MPYRIAMVAGKIFGVFCPVATGLFGYLAAVNWGAVEAAIGVLGLALSAFLLRIAPAIARFIDTVGPSYVRLKRQLAEIRAGIDRNAGSINILTDKVSEHDRVLGDVSNALAEKIGLISPVIDPRTLGPAPSPDVNVRGGVLVVEDDPYTLRAYHGLLYRNGFAVASVSDVRSARAKLAEGPECVILDLKLPDGGGEELIREIRASGQAIRIVVTTGLADPERSASARALNPDAFLLKPLELSELLAAVRGGPPVPRPSPGDHR